MRAMRDGAMARPAERDSYVYEIKIDQSSMTQYLHKKHTSHPLDACTWISML